ncbi:transposase [Spirosoma oryzae]
MFDETFRKMAVELSYAKGSVQEAAYELGIDSSRITKWRQTHKSPVQLTTTASRLTQEQQLIRRLQKKLKEADPERDILKKAVSIFSKGARKSEMVRV